MFRLLRSGVLAFWLAVTSVMVVLGVWAVTVAPATEPEPQPAISEMFDDAVDLRHQLVVAVRTGDTGALASTADTLARRWDAEQFLDRPAARSAAVTVLGRLEREAAEAGELDGDRRDRLAADADLFAALAAAYDNPAVVGAATDGVTASPVTATGGVDTAAGVDTRARARERLERTGVDLGELEYRMGSAGAPALDRGVLDDVELVAPTRP